MKDTEKKPKRLHSDIVRDSINTFGTNVIGSLLSIISAFFVLGVLDPAVKGQYNPVQLVGNGLFTLFGFSINAAMIYFVSRYKIKNTKKAIAKLTVAMSALILAAGAVAVLFMKEIFFSGSTAFYCWAAVVYGLFSFLMNVCLAILRGENKFKMFNTINLLQKVLLTAFMFSMLVWPSAMLLVTSMIGIQVLMILFALYGIKRWNGKEPDPAPEDDHSVQTGAMFRYSLKSHVSNVMTYINSYLGSYIVNAVYSLSTFGIYNAAVTMMQQVWLLPDAVSQVIMSRIAAMHEKDDKVRLTLMSCKVVTYITIVCAVLLVLVAQVFVPIVFPKYVEAIAPLRYLIIGSIFLCKGVGQFHRRLWQAGIEHFADHHRDYSQFELVVCSDSADGRQRHCAGDLRLADRAGVHLHGDFLPVYTYPVLSPSDSEWGRDPLCQTDL